ncbi:LysR family transcriptional regulator [Sulfitobacter sp. G21635-S1]|uniref:LysR family transcriptional regulator n=1 Tax=Sulfitobacter sp. G21635-S1 TaxID=3014043 RepID=UPI0022AFF255|nr:LysR family transcriptional regulator [Sulfitobacter sp. G21635-S1]MCZ4257367.1 LysR family transcriptional regulator [Sulfitobacter sp. G21635-S1]
MDNTQMSFDWNRGRAFLATAEHGSLSAAARALGLTQPTLSRQVAGLEQDLGVLLFDRVGKTLQLTDAGRDMLDHFKRMGAAAERISLAASGRSTSVEGHVSISASDVTAALLLPETLALLRHTAPGITVEVVASNALSDLRRREADIAIRHVRPTQHDLTAKLLFQTRAHCYAAQSYAEEYGLPRSIADFARARMIGYGEPAQMLPQIAALKLPLNTANFVHWSESGVVGWEMVRHGLGMGLMSETLGTRTTGVAPVLPDLVPEIIFPTWLVAHRELHSNPRIRLVFDFLADHLPR